jgi:hypothetical protein
MQVSWLEDRERVDIKVRGKKYSSSKNTYTRGIYSIERGAYCRAGACCSRRRRGYDEVFSKNVRGTDQFP